jgi:hypothetical protein
VAIRQCAEATDASGGKDYMHKPSLSVTEPLNYTVCFQFDLSHEFLLVLQAP